MTVHQMVLPTKDEVFALYARGKLPEAMSVAAKVLLDAKSDTEILNLVAVCHMRQGNSEQAISYLQKSLSINPSHTDANYHLGRLLAGQKRFADAEAAYRKVIQIRPDCADAHYNLGHVLAEQKKSVDAEAAFRQSLRINPEHPWANYYLGRLLAGQKRFADAESAFRQSLQINPEHAWSHYYLGRLLAGQKRFEDAKVAYRKALTIDKEDRFGARLSLSVLCHEPLPLRASESHLGRLYARRAQFWDQESQYRGDELVASVLQEQVLHHELDILDAGCGTGRVGVRIRKMARRLDGIDLSNKMLEKAREKCVYDHIEQGDLEVFMQKHPRQYDAIVCAATLIHFGDLSSVFLSAARSLRVNGCFVFTLFSLGENSDGAEVQVHPVDRLEYGGCYAHGKDYVVRTAKESGFVVELLNSEIHEYMHGKPIMCFVVLLRLHSIC
ncbi:MAG: tetratricopeptide repeat protein [Magnetococcales bacterium]|nr:tetratricopeptide repeat protein [Magnetococcales bacterium]